MTVGETEQAAILEAAGEAPVVGLVSVIVPHLDDYDNLDACLTLLGEQSFPSDRTEIIIADNGSSRGLDALRELVGRAAASSRSRNAARARRATRAFALRGRGARVHRQRLPA